MNEIDYDASKNEVTVTNCINCPFCHMFNIGFFCQLNESISIDADKIPSECSLRDPNFKLTRVLE